MNKNITGPGKKKTLTKAKASASPVMTAEREVMEVIEVYRQGFLQLDPKLLWSIWDHGYGPLIYVAMEKPKPIHGWPAIKRYYAALPEHLEKVEAKKLENVRIDVLGDTAIAFFQFHSTVKLKGREQLYRPGGRATILFRRIQNGWRVIHYHESALAAQAADAMAARSANAK